jgi:hypothetical protein
MYFLGIWMYLALTTGGNDKGLPLDGYHMAIGVHLLGTAYLCAVVVRDALFPDRDPVRWDGSDDPSGGVLDGAEDAFVLGRGHGSHAAPARYGDAPRAQWGTGPGAGAGEEREPA